MANDEAYQKLWFDFRHITDELVFYGMCAQSAHLITPLANLCYKMLFRHEAFETFTVNHRDASANALSGAIQPRQQRRLLALGPEARYQLPSKLMQWAKQLSYFLMHFPDVEGGIAPLRRIQRSLIGHSKRRGDASALPSQGPQGDAAVP